MNGGGVKYKDTLADARKYNQAKDPKRATADCSGCGDTIPMTGENCVEFGVYACKVCRKGENMGDEKEKITIELDASAEAGLKRLVRHYKISASEVVERLIKKADSEEAEKVLKRDGPKAQTVYYDGPKQ